MSSRISINPFFTPTQISGCQLWLDAADSTTFSLINNSIITQWRDKSGNGRIATPGGSPVLRQKSINGLSSIYYDGNTTGAFTGSISITTSSIYAFVVFVSNMNAGSEGMRLISFSGSGTADWNSSSTGIMFLYDTNRIQTWRNSSTTTNLTCPAQGSTILSTTYYNGSIAYNSLFGGTSSSAIGSSGSFNITTFNMTFGNVNMKGNLAEIIIYNSVLTTAQVQQVEGYLAWKWGIQGSLPTNNPYKLSFLPSLLNPPVTVPTGTAITSYVGWSPLNVPRCGLWLDAADPSTFNYSSGSNVSVWTDKSAGIPAQFLTNAMATARAGTSPNGDIGKLGSTNYPVSGYNINGVNCLYFNQAILQAITTQSTTTRTYFAVVRFPSPFTSGALLWPATWSSIYAFGGSIQVNSTGVIFASQNVANLLALNYSTDTPFIISITFNNGTTNMWNTGGGTTIPTGQTSATLGSSDNYLWIGGVSGYYMSPYLMGEFLEYNSALSTSQRQQVEGYLAWKWGLSGSLPATHPYKSFPPSTRSTIVPVSVAKTATWQPTQISGCQLWLDANDLSSLVLSGTVVSAWRDKSGNLNNATSVNNPLYNFTTLGVDFTRTSAQYFTLPDGCFPFNNSSYSYFYIFTPKSTLAGQTLTFGGSNNGTASDFGKSCALRTGDAGTGTLQAYWFSFDLQTSNTYTTNIKNFAATYYTSGGSRSIWINFLQGASDTPGIRSQRSTMNMIGANAASTTIGDFLNAQLHEILVYNFALSTSQRQQVEGYLAWKWNLISALPSNHPFKLWPPLP